MEEPPKIERIISVQGVTLSDTATILKTYLADIDQYHHHPSVVDSNSPEHGAATVTQEDQTPQPKGNDKYSHDTPRKSRQEREEEALIAQMDRLVDDKLSSGMISDDVYERLKMISDSICAEVEGRPWSASGVVAAALAAVTQEELGDDDDDDEQEVAEQNDDDGAGAFLAELEGAVKLEQQGGDLEQQQQHQQQPTPNKSKRDKKKEKKAKKAAKKAKKDAKRKSKEMEVVGDEDLARASKRVKTE